LREEINGERLHPKSHEMGIIQIGQNVRQSKAHFDGGDLEVLLTLLDEKPKYMEKNIRGKMKLNYSKIMKRFVDSKYQNKNIFDPFVTTANKLTGDFGQKTKAFPKAVLILRAFFIKANMVQLKVWRIGLIKIPKLYSLCNDADLCSICNERNEKEIARTNKSRLPCKT